MIITAFVGIVFSSRKPMGIYRLFSDDVAGTIAYKFKDFDDVQIYTSDKDYLQLVTEESF